jgi:hypothetical protein
MPTPGTAGVFIETYSSFPTELAAWSPFPDNPSYRLGAALLFYSNDYDPTKTFGQSIYWFLSMAQDKSVSPYINFLIVGHAYVPDPVTSTTPQVELCFAWEVSGVNTQFGQKIIAPQSHNMYSMFGNVTSQDGQDSFLNGNYYLYNNNQFITLWLISDLFLDATRAMDGGGVVSYNTPGLFEGVEPVANFPEIALSQASNAGITPGGAAAPYNPDTMGASRAMRTMAPGKRAED